MLRNSFFTLFVLLAMAVLAACTPDRSEATEAIGMPNPASVYCEEQGGSVEMRQDEAGGEYGVCKFENGSECDEWAYYRGECTPEEAEPTPADANMANPASVYCEEHGGTVEMRQDEAGGVYGMCVFSDGSECDEWAFFRRECPAKESDATVPADTIELASDGCQVYHNETLGYSFHYPADAVITDNAEPLKSITIAGPQLDGDTWPAITISHPTDREDYRPPEGMDLEQWLTDHNLIGDTRLEDVQIAGITAIHLRHDRSPQSYAYDRYYFAHAGQLYMIVIGHTGDREDWELYNHFLASFQF